MTGKRVVFLMVAALLVQAAFISVQADTIFRKNGIKIKDVQVTKETIKEATYVLSGPVKVIQRMPTQKIARVEYENKPPEWEQAINDMRQNFFKEAINRFTRCARLNADEFPWIRQYSLFKVAETYRAWAEAGEDKHFTSAVAAYQELLKGMPDTVHRYSCLLGVAKCYLALSKTKEASSLFGKIIKDNFDPRYNIRAKIGLARILEIGKKYREARSKFREIFNEARSLARSDPSLSEIPNLALVREGACIVGLRKFDEALTFFQDILTKADSDEVLAGAYNGLGDAYYAKRKIEKAMWAFLKVAIVFEHITAEAPKALYYASLTMKDLSSKIKDPVLAKKWNRRSRGLKNDLRQRFPGSPWAKRR
jgi:tetratricopeptide (TPR) repeat protein